MVILHTKIPACLLRLTSRLKRKPMLWTMWFSYLTTSAIFIFNMVLTSVKILPDSTFILQTLVSKGDCCGLIVEKCEIVNYLQDSGVNETLWDRWTCLADGLSGSNTSKVKESSVAQSDPCSLYSLGLFQISNNWCTTEGDVKFGNCKVNGCRIDCLQLLDEDLTDDIKCISTIQEINGVNKWPPISMQRQCQQEIAQNKWNHTVCETNQRRSQISSIPIWAAILIVILSCLIVFVLTYVYYRYRRNRSPVLSIAEIKEFKYGSVGSTRPVSSRPLSEHVQENFINEPYNTEYEVTPSDFTIDRNCCLGSGAYGVVFKGTCKTKIVAVKTLKPHATKEYLQSLLGEIKILSHIGRHDCIVNLDGAYTKALQKGTVYVFMEYCGLGSLEKFLRSKRPNFVHIQDAGADKNTNGSGKGCITIKHLFQYAHQIAKGMDFLATKQVIHGDLAARNVLLVDQNTAKISDFGLSRKLYGYINYIKKKEEPLPWRWMAIESLKEMNFSTSSDVWMYGVLLFEIFSLGDVPYPGLSWSLEFVESLENGLRILRPKNAPVNVYQDVMLRCWEANPADRPDFVELSNFFYQALHKITSNDYLEVVEAGDMHYTKDYRE